ncbi:hypothetical protein [Actinosynnema mirum]|uniref:Uncharacterized protein n=1 Tax=Actinosynnema mirum (strain ATCC 29888 / DSM 43827 / JCM 3225 / NBRC 14064 / NCIMB 13271 / NRRL B-12336 / IMRU 3971 / 101) TaxID=446462 RepID=C6WC70_ACTMD|nr:hypothetical protein [Actinosynnema mirum]ACU39458.1 hypothetical protein Amir_5642 [Actinosynnema mirum DSM 43827]
MTTPEQTRKRWTFQHVITLVVAVLVVASVVQAVTFYQRTERIVGCQQGYQRGFAAALDARTQVSAEAQLALDEVMRVVSVSFSADGALAQREQVRAAINDYLTKREQARETQRQNPYPAAPEELCR